MKVAPVYLRSSRLIMAARLPDSPFGLVCARQHAATVRLFITLLFWFYKVTISLKVPWKKEENTRAPVHQPKNENLKKRSLLFFYFVHQTIVLRPSVPYWYDLFLTNAVFAFLIICYRLWRQNFRILKIGNSKSKQKLKSSSKCKHFSVAEFLKSSIARRHVIDFF